ncbi:MAG: DUF817 domain-containing protein [Pyrinomonadaceae bacterium]|nr:DUF817 domain-containing protein [Pyrinomonadaceae bacterium]
MRESLTEFVVFGLKEMRACIFPGAFFAILLISKLVHVPGIPRYDLIFLLTITLQVLLLLFKIETLDEAMTLVAFHVIGLVLELFKTHPAIGSWSYPESGFLKIGGVPLYSGFKYAAVGSYLCQAWRIFKLELYNYPSYWLSVPLAIAIYANFFAHHFTGYDLRWWLMLTVLIVFRRAVVRFTVWRGRNREMPLAVAFFLIGFFIWVAKNIATYLGAWAYPEQQRSWQLVSLGKISSWFLLVIISFVIVADLKYVRGKRRDVVVREGESNSPGVDESASPLARVAKRTQG